MTQIIITTTQTWTVPADWNNAANTIEVWGAGAGGAANNNSANTGAGGGGAYSKKNNVTLSIGAGITAHVGTGGAGETASTNAVAGGDSWFNGTAVVGSTCGAKGGAIGSGTTGGAGGAAASGVGDAVQSGGKGGNGNADGSGGGGGGAGGVSGDGVAGTAAAAGSTANGSNGGAGDAGSGGAGGSGLGTSGSKNGANGTASNLGGGGGQGGYSNEGNGGNGGISGGGGGSAGNNTGTHLGGAGGAGQIIITYTPAGGVTIYGSFWDAIFPHKQTAAVKLNKTDTSFISIVTPIEGWLGYFPSQLNTVKYPNKGTASFQFPYPTVAPVLPVGYGSTYPNYSLLARSNYLNRISNALGPSGSGTSGIPIIPLSSGPLRFIFFDGSQTKGAVQPYNDGIISVPTINVNNRLPLVTAARLVMTKAGVKARPYKMEVIQNGVVIFTLRSILWTTYMITPTDPAYTIIDGQNLNSPYV